MAGAFAGTMALSAIFGFGTFAVPAAVGVVATGCPVVVPEGCAVTDVDVFASCGDAVAFAGFVPTPAVAGGYIAPPRGIEPGFAAPAAPAGAFGLTAGLSGTDGNRWARISAARM